MLRYVHCGLVCASRSREILPTLDESLNHGIQSVIAYEYWCQKPECRRKLFFRSDRIDFGFTPMRRVKPKDKTAFMARLEMAPESNAVKAQKHWEGKVLAAMKWKQVN